MDERELYHAEIGRYLKAVSSDYPVGVCTRCGSLRARHDVNPKESCPAGLLEQVGETTLRSTPHEWQAASDGVQLEGLLSTHFSEFKRLADAAGRLVSGR